MACRYELNYWYQTCEILHARAIIAEYVEVWFSDEGWEVN